jgi:predicted DNA-binding transcriptional regulator AlpA
MSSSSTKSPDALLDIRVVDRKTAAELIGVSPRTFDRLIALGDAPRSTKLSARRIGYRICDLRAWLDARRSPAEAAAAA